MNIGPFKYAQKYLPPGYKCFKCGAVGCKLWRPACGVDDFECAACLVKHGETKEIDRFGFGMWQSRRLCALNDKVPCVPDEDGTTMWGYTSIPQAGVVWWMRLPLLPGSEWNEDVCDECANGGEVLRDKKVIACPTCARKRVEKGRQERAIEKGLNNATCTSCRRGNEYSAEDVHRLLGEHHKVWVECKHCKAEIVIEEDLTQPDIHTATATEVFGLTREEVTPDIRRAGKTINFGVVYGKGDAVAAAVASKPIKPCDHSAQSWSLSRSKRGYGFCDDCKSNIKKAHDGLWYPTKEEI